MNELVQNPKSPLNVPDLNNGATTVIPGRSDLQNPQKSGGNSNFATVIVFVLSIFVFILSLLIFRQKI